MGYGKHWRHTTHNDKQHFIQNWTRLYPPESWRCLCYKLLTIRDWHDCCTVCYDLWSMWHVRKSHEQGWRWWPWGEDEDEGENENDDDDDADDAAADDDDDDGVVMWWCGSKFKLSKGNNRSDRKAKVGSLEFLAFRVGMGLFLFTPNHRTGVPHVLESDV